MNQNKKYNSPAEDFFKEHGISMILFRQTCIDETGRYKEGDYRLSDGRLLEVKTDTRCFSSTKPTGNIPIEIDHPRHGGRKGWYHHCIMEGVAILLFVCCDDANCKYAVRYISIPMNGLKEFVTEKMQDAAYMKNHFRTTWDGVGNLCVPFEDILSIPGTRQLIPVDRLVVEGNHVSIFPTQPHRKDGAANEQNPVSNHKPQT